MPYLSANLPIMLISSGITPPEAGKIFAITYGLISIFMMFPWTLVLISIFKERQGGL